MHRRAFVLCLLLLGAALPALASDGMRLEVVQLNHRSAEELIPTLQPFVDPGGALRGSGYRLIVRTTPRNLAELKQLLGDLDTPLRRLLISVARHDGSEVERRGIGVDAEVDLGNQGRARVQSPPSKEPGVSIETGGDVRTRTRVHSTQRRSESPGFQQVQTLEGHWATIQAGLSVPMVERRVDAFGRVQDSVTYKDVTRGFEVLPRVQGERVILSIRPHRAELTGRGGQIAVQDLQTTVEGPLGSWLELGNIATEETDSARGTLHSSRSRAQSQAQVRVKVELLP